MALLCCQLYHAKTENIDFTVESKIVAQRVIAQNLVVYILVGSPVDLELIDQNSM